MFNNIRIVLVETSHPGNIGAVARAMKNMRLTSLYLVRPQVFPSADATARAAGADDVLARAVVCDTLTDAIADCALVMGTSARSRSIPWPTADARECAQRLRAESETAPVALVFGNEQSGLSNAELDRCHALVHIPCNTDFSSLNLAAAAQILAYEILLAHGVGVTPPPAEQPPATHAEMERLYQHLEATLTDLEFHDPDNPRQLMRRLRRLFQRAGLDQNELNILRGILSAMDEALERERNS